MNPATPQTIVEAMSKRIERIQRELAKFKAKFDEASAEGNGYAYVLNWNATGAFNESIKLRIFQDVKTSMEKSIKGENKATVQSLQEFALDVILRKAGCRPNSSSVFAEFEHDATLEAWAEVYNFIVGKDW